jgi:GntR family transcriptional repressor for pyruvate dehydrogenase complex
LLKETKPVTFDSFEKDVLPEKIVKSLLSLIKEKQLLPGDKLPPERELAELMHVGRPALREALRALSIMNVVEVRPGSGTYVTALQPEQLVAHLDFVFDLDEPSIFHLFDTRKTLELRTVTLAAQQISAEEIAELECCLAEMIAATDGSESRESLDRKFHRSIAVASGNPFLARFVRVVNRLGIQYRRQTDKLPGATGQTARDHQAIIDALRTQDPEIARQRMLQHLEHAEQNLRLLLSDQN